MPDYKTMYFQLAARVADAIDLLVEAQQQGEESYISDNSIPLAARPSRASQTAGANQRQHKNGRSQQSP